MIDDRFLADNTAVLPASARFFDSSSPDSSSRSGSRRLQPAMAGVSSDLPSTRGDLPGRGVEVARGRRSSATTRCATSDVRPASRPALPPVDQESAHAVDWAHVGCARLFHALEALKGQLADSGIDAEAARSDPAWKNRLKAENDAAIAAGVSARLISSWTANPSGAMTARSRSIVGWAAVRSSV